jgi:hypothetical protein
MPLRSILFPLFVLFLILAVPAMAQEGAPPEDGDDDRHAGYYYPTPNSHEHYPSRARLLPQASRALRLGFVTGFTAKQLERPVSPDFVFFAKGQDAQKAILVSLVAGRLDTPYRARALLAQLTAVARTLPLFRDQGVEDRFTFLDLAKMLGFTQVTVSDGALFAHQITIE